MIGLGEFQGRCHKVYLCPVPRAVLERFPNDLTIPIGNTRRLRSRGEVTGQPANQDAFSEDVLDTCSDVCCCIMCYGVRSRGGYECTCGPGVYSGLVRPVLCQCSMRIHYQHQGAPYYAHESDLPQGPRRPNRPRFPLYVQGMRIVFVRGSAHLCVRSLGIYRKVPGGARLF